MRSRYSLPDAASGRAPAAGAEILCLMRRELEAAREVQSCLFPGRMHVVEGLDYYGECRPASDLGGDFFDFVPLPERGLLLSIGDVSGHGIGAAIIMSGLQALLRSLSAGGNGQLPRVVQGLNRSVCDVSPANVYATLFYAWIDPARRLLKYVSAGHEPALLFRPGGRTRRLESTGTVLGLTARSAFREAAVALEAGDVLVAFTDGVTEAADSHGHEFREEGVVRVLERYPKAGAAELSGRILDSVANFRTPSSAADDRTVVVVRLVPAVSKQPFLREEAEVACAAA